MGQLDVEPWGQPSCRLRLGPHSHLKDDPDGSLT